MTTAAAGTRRTARLVVGIVLVVALLAALGCVGLLAQRYRLFAVSGGSMQPTFVTGDRMVVRTDPGPIRRGDIVVIDRGAWTGPRVPDSDQVKRVLGVGGDTVMCCDARQRATLGGASGDGGGQAIVVPQGRLFLVGDNPEVSMDSRSHLDIAGGTVDANLVAGRVDAVAWPFSHRASIAPGPVPLALGALLGAALAFAAAVAGSLMDQRTPDPAVRLRPRPGADRDRVRERRHR